MGSEIEISEDTNVIKEIYASHLIACFRLGHHSMSVSMFRVCIAAVEQVGDWQVLDSLLGKKTPNL